MRLDTIVNGVRTIWRVQFKVSRHSIACRSDCVVPAVRRAHAEPYNNDHAIVAIMDCTKSVKDDARNLQYGVCCDNQSTDNHDNRIVNTEQGIERLPTDANPQATYE